MMNWRILKVRGSVYALGILALTGALLTSSPVAVHAQSRASRFDQPIVGAWTVQVTLRDCATNAPLGPPFNSLVSFQEGGTLSENPASLVFAPGQRTSGHGAWSRKGPHTYLQRVIALMLFDTPPNLPGSPTFDPSRPVSPGFFAGWSMVTHTIQFSDWDHITSSGTNEFYKADGTQYRTGCSTAVGQRFR